MRENIFTLELVEALVKKLREFKDTNDKLVSELEEIDNTLSHRLALDNIPNRIDKINKACQMAGQYEEYLKTPREA